MTSLRDSEKALGTGKTLLAKAVADETNAHFISPFPALKSLANTGESEERIREIFTQAEESVQASSSLIRLTLLLQK